MRAGLVFLSAGAGAAPSRREPTTVPGFVLTTASAFGTLAAARCLGDHGVPVVVLDASRFAPAMWSRHVARSEAFPPGRPIDRFVDALVAYGTAHPGNVLYATSDDLAWTFAERADALRPHYRLYTPPFSCIAGILDKRALYDKAGEIGVSTPRTWFPSSDRDLEEVNKSARFPLIVKPRTQVSFTSTRKGICVSSAGELRTGYSDFARDDVHEPSFSAKHRDTAGVLVQELHAERPIYSVSGFCDPARNLFVARSSHKLLQWPRQAGVGIAFEDAPLDDGVVRGVRRLCEAIGYFGVFEVEFAVAPDGPMLIDFNPRFFGQMGFDVARGLPSAYLVYLAATGAFAELAQVVDLARDWRPTAPMLFEHGSMIAWSRAAERLAGRRPPALPGRSKGTARPIVVDAARSGGDRIPGVVDYLQRTFNALSHPAASFRAASRGYW